MVKKTLILFFIFTTMLSVSLWSCSSTKSPPSVAVPVNPSSQNVTGQNTQTTATVPVKNQVDVVYFHTKLRCGPCVYIEIRVKHNIDTYFAKEVASGKLTFQVYDLSKPENAAVAKQFGTIGSELYINTIKTNTNRIQKILEVWDNKLLNDQPAFDEFVQNLIKKNLKGIS